MEEKKEFINKQLEILKYFDSVCEKNNLKYFVFYGTLLGAVRHKGFIPWDDDIDVVMLREDYEKLRYISLKVIEKPYFLQSNYSDKINRGHAEIRNSNTACFMKCDFDAKYNCGCFIDIFPIDNIDLNTYINDYCTLKKMYKKIKNYPTKLVGNRHPIITWFYNIFVLPFVKIEYLFFEKKQNLNKFAKYEQMCSKYNSKTDKCASIEYYASMNMDKLPIYNISDFENIVYLDFENIKVPCPKGYDSILRTTYGDYMVPVKGTQMHSELYYDCNHSYKYYKKTMRNKKRFFSLFKQ